MEKRFELHPTTKAWKNGDRPSLINDAPQDNRDMRRMGKKQEFKRDFKVVSISSFAVVAMLGWLALPINVPGVIEVAGTGGLLVMFLANFFGLFTTVLSLAEMSSIAPTAGGQYHWTSEFAPPRWQKYLSYMSGWLASLSWLVGNGASMYIGGNLLVQVIALAHPNIDPTPWRGYLFVLALSIICFSINGFFARFLPLLEGFVLCFMVLVFLAIMVVLAVLSPKRTGSNVFGTFAPDLSSKGVLEILAAQVLVLYSTLASDSTAHMAEETGSAATVVPRAMVWSYCFNGFLDLAMIILLAFCDISAEQYNLVPGFPLLGFYVGATGSITGSVIITTFMIILIVISTVNYMASTSRQVFAFARDNGLPFSHWIAKVNSQTLTPINSLVVTLAVIVLVCLIGLFSSVAFNAIISLQVMAIAATYQISLICLVWRRLYGTKLPPSPWSLGRWGLPLNIFSVVYGWYLLFYSALPSVYPVTPANMNWAPVIFGGVLILSQIYYLIWARRIYEGPVVKVLVD